MRSKEAHVLESIANTALPTLQIVEYRGGTAESAPSVTPVSPVTSARPGRYTLRTIAAPEGAAPSAPTLRAAVNGYGFEESTAAAAHAQTPQVAAALRNAPGLAKLHAVTSEEHDSKLCLWYEPLDAGTLDKLLRARTLNPAELMTLARTLHRALGSLKKVGEGRAELSAEYIALSAAGVPKLLLPDAVYREAESLDAERGGGAASPAQRVPELFRTRPRADSRCGRSRAGAEALKAPEDATLLVRTYAPREEASSCHRL